MQQTNRGYDLNFFLNFGKGNGDSVSVWTDEK